MDELDKLIQEIQALANLDGKTEKLHQPTGNLSHRQELPLKDRLAQTNEEAIARSKLEKAKAGMPDVEHSEEMDDLMIEKAVDDILTRISK